MFQKIFITLIMASGIPAFAYTLSESIGGLDTQADVTPEQYFSNLYYFLLGAAAVLAVLKIVMGGLKYVAAAGNPNSISDAKEDIQWAIFGLVLALSSFLILTTIGGESLVSFSIGGGDWKTDGTKVKTTEQTLKETVTKLK